MKIPKHLIQEILHLPYEEWKCIKGFENKYQVSNYGRVKSLNYKRTNKAQILTPIPLKSGYIIVNLCKDGKPYTKYVHQLVAEAFIPNPDNLPCVNHIDEDKTNNNVNNLEWCTYEYNSNYGTRNERISYSLQGRTLTDEHKQKISKAVIMLDKDTLKPIAVFDSQIEASQYLGKASSNISHCANGKHKTAYKHIWKKVNIVEL